MSTIQLGHLLSAKPFQHAILAGLLLLSVTGCGSGTSSGISSGPTSGTSQPTTPAVPAGWVNLDRPYVSYDYPTGWKLTETTSEASAFVDAEDPAQPNKKQVLVQFVPGYPNKSNLGDQCADADQYLTDVYTNVFLPIATDPTTYPRTTVTWLYLPALGGSLGGAAGTISVSYEANVGSSVNYTVDLQAVPRQGGLYLVGIWSPDYYATPSFAKTFLSTLMLKHDFLPKGSNCSYLN
jgi:hypothetical protein